MRLLLIVAILLVSTMVSAKTLTVGPGEPYQRIEDAYARAGAGDTILVRPLPDDRPYEQVALYADKPAITIRGVLGPNGRRVKLSGKGFSYSGRGRVPRAMFQFNPGADGSTLENFELSGAANDSHNGAGVRINQANNITIRNCDIHHNHMGIMSNGRLPDGGMNQVIEFCVIHENGDFDQPGYNHNLYLGGTSVTLRGCEVYGSLTGHNVKSRAHFNWIEYCCIHDSANREFDLVDSDETAAPGSHAVLLGNIIVKDPQCKGNRAVIHFGQDGGKEHDGILALVHNTILTPFISPVVDLSAGKAKALLLGNLIDSGGVRQNGQVISQFRNGAANDAVTGSNNWFAAGFNQGLPANRDNRSGAPGQRLPFANLQQYDYRLARPVDGITAAGMEANRLQLPPIPGGTAVTDPLHRQYRHPAGIIERTCRGNRPDVGACQ